MKAFWGLLYAQGEGRRLVSATIGWFTRRGCGDHYHQGLDVNVSDRVLSKNFKVEVR
jgi:hypothetical protein